MGCIMKKYSSTVRQGYSGRGVGVLCTAESPPAVLDGGRHIRDREGKGTYIRWPWKLK